MAGFYDLYFLPRTGSLYLLLLRDLRLLPRLVFSQRSGRLLDGALLPGAVADSQLPGGQLAEEFVLLLHELQNAGEGGFAALLVVLARYVLNLLVVVQGQPGKDFLRMAVIDKGVLLGCEQHDGTLDLLHVLRQLQLLQLEIGALLDRRPN